MCPCSLFNNHSRGMTCRQANHPLYCQGMLLHARQVLPTELLNACNTFNMKRIVDGGLTRGGPLQWGASRLRAEATERGPEGAAGGPALSLAAVNMEQGRTASPAAAQQMPALPQLPASDLCICMRRSKVDSQEEQAMVQTMTLAFSILYISKARGTCRLFQARESACMSTRGFNILCSHSA